MNLEIFNNLMNNLKDSDIVQNFIDELKNSLNTKTNQSVSSKKETSLIEQTLENEVVTSDCRDKMYVERNNILKNYFNQTKDQGTLCYIYSKHSQKGEVYNMCSYGNEVSNSNSTISKSELPENAGVDSVLRQVDGKYVLDVDGTKYVENEMKKAIDELLKAQEQLLDSYRIEGHIYEVAEIAGTNNVLLNDTTLNTSKCFQEINIPSSLLNDISQRKFNSICKWRIYFALITFPIFTSCIINCNSILNII